jgi:AcrR family transcriptional regulator
MYTARRREPSKRTRERIMAAVRSLLEEGAFHESTVEEVAARAGVSRATLYQHFGSRLGLVDAMCATFDENPALIRLRRSESLDDLIEGVVDFWAAEEKILVQLYGAAAVDPAAGELVERQRRDRQSELSRVLRVLGVRDRAAFASLSVLTSFETFEELRRHAGLSKRRVLETLQDAASRLVQEPAAS